MIMDSLRKSYQAKLTVDLNTLNQVKSVVASSMAIVQTFICELEKQGTIKPHTDTEKELLESLESLYENSEDLIFSVDMAISELTQPKAHDPDLPWDDEEEQTQ